MNANKRGDDLNQNAFNGARNTANLCRLLADLEVSCLSIVEQIRSLETSSEKKKVLDELLSDFRYLRDEMGDRMQRAIRDAKSEMA